MCNTKKVKAGGRHRTEEVKSRRNGEALHEASRTKVKNIIGERRDGLLNWSQTNFILEVQKEKDDLGVLVA